MPAGATGTDRDTPVFPLPRIVPKGLRSFDERDADFFLDLLPGPRDREGLPESIRFWKTRIEETDPDKTFAVGLIYGPSGCGKSSLVKAGLTATTCAPHVTRSTWRHRQKTPSCGCSRDCARLDRHIPVEVALSEMLAGLREGRWSTGGEKTLIVLDQFEQWLHARRGEKNTSLVQALRHCDGARVQCIVLVRDDFWMPVSEFLRELEVRNVEGHNAACVSLFDERHARKVLSEFGKAYGCLPAAPEQSKPEEEAFLDAAVSGLAEDGKIICVRLALFADMLKGKPWTAATLSQVGGTEGLGVTFLEETFSASTAPAAHRYHQKAAQAVLKALLPEAGSDIKGSRQSYEALLEASGYAPAATRVWRSDPDSRQRDPPDHTHGSSGRGRGRSRHDDATESAAPTAEPAAQQEKYYQLTHDYLVPSLRDWLTRKQKETRRGRAELKLAERSALWNAKPENRHLPSLLGVREHSCAD